MTTIEKIRQSAIRHFAREGYDGASLAAIAGDAGIKKQSLYTYFKNKDELFLQMFPDVFQNELQHITGQLENRSGSHLKELLFSLLQTFVRRYQTCDSTRFLIRSSLYPPEHLKEAALHHFYNYWDQLEALLLPLFRESKRQGVLASDIQEETAVSAYLGILDSIYIEMVYGGEIRLQKRLETSWPVYWRGISNRNLGGKEIE